MSERQARLKLARLAITLVSKLQHFQDVERQHSFAILTPSVENIKQQLMEFYSDNINSKNIR